MGKNTNTRNAASVLSQEMLGQQKKNINTGNAVFLLSQGMLGRRKKEE
jgi:hypothetical protein